MNLCSHGHDEVCFDGRKCPMCEKQKEIDDLESRLADANDTSDKLQAEVANLESEIANLESQLRDTPST